MLVGIHQLHYLPWLRYLDKIQSSDVFIVLDDVQFNKNGWQNRNKVKTSTGPVTLTVPVRARAGQPLDEVLIHNGVDWRRKHARTIEQHYSRAPFFAVFAPFLEDVYGRVWERLNDLNRHMLTYFVDALSIRTPIVFSSELRVPGVATARLVNLIQAVGGDAYLSGAHAVDTYLDVAMLERHGIALQLQEWHCPEYEQLHGAFVPDLALLDLLMNCGPESLEVLCAQPI